MQNSQKTQELAIAAMERVAQRLRPGMSEAEIAAMAETEMRALGAQGWWYHGVGALVLAGKERSVLSISGRDYRARADVYLGENDLVSMDFSPVLNGAWGDYARTVYLEDGRPVPLTQRPKRQELGEGYDMERALHEELARWVTPETTYEQVWVYMNRFLTEHGWKNLDFHGNLGHSIETKPDRRIYLEQGNCETLGGHGTPFTFEPHICREESGWGFKHENIYCFGADGRLICLGMA